MLCRCGGYVVAALAFAAQATAQESDASQGTPVFSIPQIESLSNGTNVPSLSASSEVVNDAWQFFISPTNPASNSPANVA